jgi:PAS domain S-box-containing protein
MWYGTLLVAIAFWSGVYAVELVIDDPAQKLLALKIKYLGVTALPLAWLGFILNFVAWDPTIVRRVERGMAAVAVVTLLVAWTNDAHGLFWGRMTVNPGALSTLAGRGPGFWLNVAYTYAVLLAGLAILVGQAGRSPYLYRKRALILVLAAVLPWIGNLIFVAGGEAPGTIDSTPFLFSIEVIGDGLVILDRARQIADLNRAAEAMLGRDRASAAGEPIERALPDWPSHIGTEMRQDLTLSGPEGARIYDVLITPIRTHATHLTGYVVLLRDVTERRHAETALRESELRYRELVENARDLICTCDLDGRLLSINRAGLDLTGYTQDFIVGRELIDVVAPESREHAKALFTSGQTDSTSGRTEVVVLARDGHRIVFELSTSLQRRGGVPVAIQAIGRDITERRRLEEDLRQAQKMEAVGKLAGGIAHDFNNLLTAILGFATLAEEQQRPNTPIHEWIVQIRRSGEQAASLTRQLLAFGRRQTLQPVELDLNQVVDDIQKMLRRLIGENIELVVQLEPNLEVVRADRSQVQQVIMNLVVNAKDAMPHGGRITIRTRNVMDHHHTSAVGQDAAAAHYVALVVEDTGEGVEPAILERIFEPFFTTKPLGRGTGLGLATVYGIVKQSKGDLQVQSTPGHGATFTVFLPAVTSPGLVVELSQT